MVIVPDRVAAKAERPAAPAARRPGPPWWRRIRVGRAVAWCLLVASMVITLVPFYWMLRTSLSNTSSLAAGSSHLLPVDFTLGAYKRVLGLSSVQESIAQGGSSAHVDFWLYLRNSVIVSVLTTAGQVFFSAMAAYAFARLRWPGRETVFFLFLSALMVPPIFTALPNFVLIKQLGLLNTYLGIALPNLFMTPFAVFFLRQFFLGINRELEEAARLDGAGHARIFLRIILPMSSSSLTTLAMLTYITSWNDYFWPLLVGRAESVRVLTVALGVFHSQTPGSGPDWAGLMAATLLAASPIMVLFALLGRRIVNSISFTGIK